MENLLSLLLKSQQSPVQSLANFIPYLGYTSKLNDFSRNSNELARASVDLDSPTYKKLYGQFRQQGQANLAESIAELQRQNRKASALGRTPLLSQERGGETIFRGLNQGYQDVQNNASNQALNQITNAYAINATQDQVRQRNALQKSDVMGNIGGALAKLFGL